MNGDVPERCTTATRDREEHAPSVTPTPRYARASAASRSDYGVHVFRHERRGQQEKQHVYSVRFRRRSSGPGASSRDGSASPWAILIRHDDHSAGAQMAPRPPALGRAPAKPVRARLEPSRKFPATPRALCPAREARRSPWRWLRSRAFHVGEWAPARRGIASARGRGDVTTARGITTWLENWRSFVATVCRRDGVEHREDEWVIAETPHANPVLSA